MKEAAGLRQIRTLPLALSLASAPIGRDTDLNHFPQAQKLGCPNQPGISDKPARATDLPR